MGNPAQSSSAPADEDENAAARLLPLGASMTRRAVSVRLNVRWRDDGRYSNFAKLDALPAEFRDPFLPEARNLEQGMHPMPHKPVVRPTPSPNHPAVCFPVAVGAE